MQGREQGHHGGHDGREGHRRPDRVVPGEHRAQPQDGRDQVQRPDHPQAVPYLLAQPRLARRRRGRGQPAREVGREHGQLRAGPCAERVPDPAVQLLPGQALLYERDLERLDDPLPVGVRYPVARPCHHRAPPTQRDTRSIALRKPWMPRSCSLSALPLITSRSDAERCRGQATLVLPVRSRHAPVTPDTPRFRGNVPRNCVTAWRERGVGRPPRPQAPRLSRPASRRPRPGCSA